MNNPAQAYTDDAQAGFAKNGWLLYGTNTHTSVVADTDVGVTKPKTTTWKFHSSGVYTYNPSAGHEWNVPMCEGTAIVNTSLASQNWTWDLDSLSGPTAYKDD